MKDLSTTILDHDLPVILYVRPGGDPRKEDRTLVASRGKSALSSKTEYELPGWVRNLAEEGDRVEISRSGGSIEVRMLKAAEVAEISLTVGCGEED